MLSNAYFLAKFRFDTAENEPAKNLQNFAKFANFADPNPLTLTPNPNSKRAASGSSGGRSWRTAQAKPEDLVTAIKELSTEEVANYVFSNSALERIFFYL